MPPVLCESVVHVTGRLGGLADKVKAMSSPSCVVTPSRVTA
jgi:hypothetical protein